MLYASALPKRYQSGSEPVPYATTSDSKRLLPQAPRASTWPSPLDEPTPVRNFTTVLKPPPHANTNQYVQVVSQLSPGMSVSMPSRVASTTSMSPVPLSQVPAQVQNPYPTPPPTSSETAFSPTQTLAYTQQQMTPTSGTFTSPSFSSGLPSPPYMVATPQSAPAQPFMNVTSGIPSPPPAPPPQYFMNAVSSPQSSGIPSPPPAPQHFMTAASGIPSSPQPMMNATSGLPSPPLPPLPLQSTPTGASVPYQNMGLSTPSVAAPTTTTTSLPYQHSTSQSTASTSQHSETNQLLMKAGKKVGMYALKKVGGAIVSNAILPGLQNLGLQNLNLNIPGLDLNQLQGALQGSPGVDYHKIIQALSHHAAHSNTTSQSHHQNSSSSEGVNYHALIAELQKLQQMAAAQSAAASNAAVAASQYQNMLNAANLQAAQSNAAMVQAAAASGIPAGYQNMLNAANLQAAQSNAAMVQAAAASGIPAGYQNMLNAANLQAAQSSAAMAQAAAASGIPGYQNTLQAFNAQSSLPVVAAAAAQNQQHPQIVQMQNALLQQQQQAQAQTQPFQMALQQQQQHANSIPTHSFVPQQQQQQQQHAQAGAGAGTATGSHPQVAQPNPQHPSTASQFMSVLSGAVKLGDEIMQHMDHPSHSSGSSASHPSHQNSSSGGGGGGGGGGDSSGGGGDMGGLFNSILGGFGGGDGSGNGNGNGDGNGGGGGGDSNSYVDPNGNSDQQNFDPNAFGGGDGGYVFDDTMVYTDSMGDMFVQTDTVTYDNQY